MLIRKAKQKDIERALSVINRRKYEGNIVFKRFDREGKRVENYRVTLGVENSRAPGSRFSPFTGYRVAAACWHAHGDFYDALFFFAPDAEIVALGKKITKEEGNWEDSNIGSMMQPCAYSNACDCNMTGLSQVKVIKPPRRVIA